MTLGEEDRRRLRRLEEELLVRRFLAARLAEKPITEVEMRQYYESHPEQFTIPEKRKVSHIVVRDRPTAETALARLKEGADFGALAKEYNRDGSTKNSGDLGWILRGVMVRAFEDAAFRLSKGQTSDIVQTSLGWHIILLDDIRPAEKRTFEDSAADVRNRLGEERILRLEEQLRKKYPVTIGQAAQPEDAVPCTQGETEQVFPDRRGGP